MVVWLFLNVVNIIIFSSKYHNSYAKSGDRNPKWNGATPYEAQQYLNAVWRKTRAELARQAIRQYGFRIAEPQHDSTPHWHLLVFIEPKHKDTLISIKATLAMIIETPSATKSRHLTSC